MCIRCSSRYGEFTWTQEKRPDVQHACTETPLRHKQRDRRYLQQLVGQIGLNQPVVHGDVEQLVLRPLGQAEDLLKLRENNIVFIHAEGKLHRGNDRASAVPVFTHMSRGFFIAEHVGVGGHDGRPRLLGDAGGLRGSLALVHQLLHGVCDALVT